MGAAAVALDLPTGATEDLLELLVDAHMLGVAGAAGDGGFVFELPGLLMCVLTADSAAENTENAQTTEGSEFVPGEVIRRGGAPCRARPIAAV